MPMAALPASRTDRNLQQMVRPFMMPMQTPPMLVSDSFAKDAILAWFKGEFAAANAIIDELLSHLAQIGRGSEYDSLFASIHRRRLNWFPVIQMQKYHSIADVVVDLRHLAANYQVGEFEEKGVSGQGEKGGGVKNCLDVDREKSDEKSIHAIGISDDDNAQEDDSPDSDITDSGSQDTQANLVFTKFCSSHEACGTRPSQIKLTKGFNAKESVKGHLVNVVKGLKLYEDIFTDAELCKLTDFANELHAAGRNGELSGETFILFNKQMKGIKREMIQLGVPIFGPIKEEAKANIEPIPAFLQDVIDHLVQWQLIPEYKRPNGCIINFFEQDEYSQPFLKPPHLDQPVSTLLLCESTMAYGRTLACDNDGDYKGPLMLSLNKGSLLVMRGNSVDTARHVMCPSPSRRISITFFRVKPDSNHCLSPTNPTANAITLWQPTIQNPHAIMNSTSNGFETMPKWGMVRAPMVMLAPVRPVVLSPRKLPRGGTGVFLPWNVPSRKHARHLPPRAQRGRLLTLPSPVETHMAESTSSTSSVE